MTKQKDLPRTLGPAAQQWYHCIISASCHWCIIRMIGVVKARTKGVVDKGVFESAVPNKDLCDRVIVVGVLLGE